MSNPAMANYRAAFLFLLSFMNIFKESPAGFVPPLIQQIEIMRCGLRSGVFPDSGSFLSAPPRSLLARVPGQVLAFYHVRRRPASHIFKFKTSSKSNNQPQILGNSDTSMDNVSTQNLSQNGRPSKNDLTSKNDGSLEAEDATTSTSVSVVAWSPNLLLMQKMRETDKYKEDSRMYRRTVFTSADWIQFRSTGRIFENMATMFTSGVIRGLWLEIGPQRRPAQSRSKTCVAPLNTAGPLPQAPSP